jgi:hypothetical protein
MVRKTQWKRIDECFLLIVLSTDPIHVSIVRWFKDPSVKTTFVELVRSVVGLLFCDQVDLGCLLSEYEKLCLVLVGMFWYRGVLGLIGWLHPA